MSRILRVPYLYEDERGNSEVKARIAEINRSDPAKGRLIMNKVRLLEAIEYEDALKSKLIKRPTATIFVLRVQAKGFASYRLPFFEHPCAKEPTIIIADCVKRPSLDRRGAYSALIEKAEELRVEWIERHCKGAKHAGR